MKKLVVEIKYDNIASDFTPLDVQRAMENIFGLNTFFAVKALGERQRLYKRNNARIVKSFPLSYYATNAEEPGGQALSKNLSRDGIKILANTFLSLDRHVTVHIPFPESTAAIGAQVVWCFKREDSRGFDAGLKFLEIDDNIQRKLNYLLKQ
jgi:c-di-GMP-binding flagellar brake protein YcgR